MYMIRSKGGDRRRKRPIPIETDRSFIRPTQHFCKTGTFGWLVGGGGATAPGVLPTKMEESPAGYVSQIRNVCTLERQRRQQAKKGAHRGIDKGFGGLLYSGRVDV